VRPVYAVVIPLIGHIWAKFYGTLGSSWIATMQVVELDGATARAAAWQTGALMSIQAVLGGFTVTWMYGRWPAVRHAWPLVLIIAGIHGVGKAVIARSNPELAAFIPATAAMLVLYPLSRWRRFAEPAEAITERPAMRTQGGSGKDDVKPPMGQGMSYFPYVLLTVIALSVSIIEPLNRALGAFKMGLAFPKVATGYAVTTEGAEAYSPLAPLTHPGASLTVAALIAWWVYHARGYYDAWSRAGGTKRGGVLHGLLKGAIPASVPILAFLVMASVMNHSGQNETLALGIAAVAPAAVFAALSNGIGVVGAFTTSSSTSSNVLFTDLQVTVARLKKLPVGAIIAAQSAGGAIGNAIAPANAVMGASTANVSGQEGAIIRKTIPWTLAAFVLTATLLLVLLTE